MALVGIVSMFCFVLITRAFALARAAVLAPLQYRDLVGRADGLCRLARQPGLPIIIGNAVIIGGGLYLLWVGRVAEEAMVRSIKFLKAMSTRCT